MSSDAMHTSLCGTTQPWRDFRVVELAWNEKEWRGMDAQIVSPQASTVLYGN